MASDYRWLQTEPPHPLRQAVGFSYGDPGSSNLLINGDNLAALERLAPHFCGSVRCIYIDPPYNNRERYTHYDDRASHDAWISAVERRLVALREFLTEDGSLWISIDDTNVHYLKVVGDRIFGRSNFITTIVWEHRTTRENRKAFSNNHEYLLLFAKSADRFRSSRRLVPPSPEILKRYSNPDNDPRGPWQSISANVQAGHATSGQFYEIQAPSGRRHRPPKGRCWVYTKERMEAAIAENRVWFGRDGKGVPRLKRYLASAGKGVTPQTLWKAAEVGTTRSAKRHLLQLLPDEAVFDTPKPEQLVSRILAIATGPGDLVLDAYLGSGTTAAVAHKMGRAWIGIEQGAHAVTHCVPRLEAVVDGRDQGGISADVNWKGGGGFSVCRLGSIEDPGAAARRRAA